MIVLSAAQTTKTQRSAATTVGPMADAVKSDIAIPMAEHARADRTAKNVTLLKVLKSCIADRAGKMISADANSAPSIFIATTTVMAVMTAIIVL